MNGFLKNLPEQFQELVGSQLSPDTLKQKINELSKEERAEFNRIKDSLGILTDNDFIEFFLKQIKMAVIPKDRDILSQPLMDLLPEIKNIQYAEKITNFKNKCETTTDELYTIIMETLHSLWVKQYEKEEAYRRFEIYKEFERVLFKDPRYRDHFIHQFQVFLSGLPIIDKHYELIKSAYSSVFIDSSEIEIEFSWMLAATFHDIGYLVQQFDKWLNSFFKEFLDISDLPMELDLSQLLLVRNFQEYIDKLTSFYFTLDNKKGKWKYSGLHEVDHEFRKMLTSKLINERNHGIISSLILLDRIENSNVAPITLNYMDGIFSSKIVPAALAITLHDKSIFLDDKVQPIEFEKNPLSFILIYCDSIQEWGRPLSSDFKTLDNNAPHLSKFDISDSKVSATLTYTKIKKITDDKTTFDYKKDEIEKVLGNLKSHEICFEITLQSLDDKYNIPERTYRSL